MKFVLNYNRSSNTVSVSPLADSSEFVEVLLDSFIVTTDDSNGLVIEFEANVEPDLNSLHPEEFFEENV